MIHRTGINFTAVRNLVTAAEAMQEAGDDKMCESILKILREAIDKNQVKK